MKIITLPLLFAMLICGCSGTKVPPNHLSDNALQGQRLIAKYGEVSTPFIKSYLGALTTRLVDSIPATHRRYRGSYQVVLIGSEEVAALSPGDGRILITRGLISRLPTEGELAFVLAHEISHYELGHTAMINENPDAIKRSDQHRFEIAADEHAVGILALAGYDPRIAPFAIEHVYGYPSEGYSGQISRGDTDTHPDTSLRVQSINDYVQLHSGGIVGTVQRRSYAKFRAGVLNR